MSSEILQDKLRTTEGEAISNHEIVKRAVHRIEPYKLRYNFENLIASNRVRLYLGIDPTSPYLHVGHTVPLRKLSQFQEAGHEVILLFGTFTGMIGDPTDKSATRVQLTKEQIEENVATYAEQASRILDLSSTAKNPIKITYNHEWLSKLTYENIIDQASNISVQQTEQRKSFRERKEKGEPVWLHEYLYPLMQAWDAVHLDVDLEVGGKDQIPNMMVGRDFVKHYRSHDKWVLATKLIEDPEGRKMGKTEGSIVNILDLPEAKYEGIMAWPDSTIPLGFELVTSVPMSIVYELEELVNDIQEGKANLNPMILKEALAYRVVAELDSVEDARYAQEEFNRVKRQGHLPRRMEEMPTEKGNDLLDILIEASFATKEIEAKRLIKGGSVFVNGTCITENFKWKEQGILQLGKRSIKNSRRILIK